MRFGRFNLVGLLGAAVQLAAFWLLERATGLPAAGAAAISVEVSVLHNFFWHERFTWRDRPVGRGRRRVARLGRFHAANGLISIAGNTAVTYGLVQFAHVPALASAGAAIVICAPLNFLCADRWVYAAAQPQPQGGAD